MRKVDIRARVEQLDQRLARRKDTPGQQDAERLRLISECQAAGDHVFMDTLVFVQPGNVPQIVPVCEFCRLRPAGSQEEIRRNLVTAYRG